MSEIPERCSSCDAAARHAYSDATTPGFFYDKCEYHRMEALQAKVREQSATIAALHSTDRIKTWEINAAVKEVRKQEITIREQTATIERLTEALNFVDDLAQEHYAEDEFSVATEVVLRHIITRCDAALAAAKEPES